nr:ras-responsive element-binding protein 1 isoform X1 [Nothobranchius furzeri]
MGFLFIRFLQTTSAEDAGLYSASLMKHLNLQRGRGQFCDCVLRQNSDQVYPVHRCVLAASSPVLASILSSTGALVELQDPCLSESVIVFLLDYIYTGILPSSLSQQQYHRLLTAARHLQIKELQEALRAAWKQLIAEDISSNGAVIHTFDDPPLISQTVQGSSNVGVFEEAQINSAGLDSRFKGGGKDCDRPYGKTLKIPNSSCSLESVDRVNAHDAKDVPHFAQDLMQNGCASSEGCDLPGANQGELKNEAKSSSFVNSDILQRCTEGELPRKSEGRRRSSSSSSSSSHLWCGAVPVIRYSRRASVLQLAEAWEVSQFISSNTTPVSRSSSTDNDNSVKGVTTNEAGSQDSGNHNKENVCTIHPDLCNNYSGSISHQLIPNSNEQSCKGLAPNTDHTEQALHDSSQSKGLKHQMESDFDRLPSKLRHLDCYEWNVSPTREAKEQIKNWGLVDPFPVQDSETGSDSCSEDSLEVEAKEEHDFSGKFLLETDTQDNRCDLNGPETNWYPSKRETISIQQENKPNSTSNAPEAGLDDAPGPRNSTSTKSTESCSYVEDIYGTIDQRCYGNLHSEWLPHPDAHLSADRHSKPVSSHNSGDSSDEGEAGSSAVSPPHGPDSVQTSMPPTSSVCKPLGLPADRSAHLSSPNHQPLQCSLCDRSFSQRGSLNRHVRSHLGVRPFPCPRCPMTFSRQYRVTEHMRVHLRCPLGNGHQKTSDSFIKGHEERPQN